MSEGASGEWAGLRGGGPAALEVLREAAASGDAIRVREAWRRAQRALAPAPGPEAADPGGARRRSELVDALVTGLHARAGLEDVACVALGGYGRRELAPGSDVDLLLLRAQGQADPAAVEAFLRLLWDAGLPVSHAVRTVEAAVAALGRDLTAATATLEGRLVAGPRAVFDALARATGGFLAADRERFVRAKLAEADERHRERAPTVLVLVPDLKLGRGTARDLQLVRLLATLVHGVPDGVDLPATSDRVLPGLDAADACVAAWLGLDEPERAAFDRAGRLLLASRVALHELVETKDDRLELELQARLAHRFGFDAPGRDRGGRLPVEAFMDEVYRAARLVDRLLGRARLAVDEHDRPAVRLRPLAPGVGAFGEEIVLDPPAPAPAQAPAALATLFLQALRSRRRLAPRTLEDARRAVVAAGAAAIRAHPASAAALREVLAGARGVADVVRAMHETGWLGALLPELAAVECLAQADPYHAYTVDEHTLAVVRGLEGPDGAGAPEREDLLRDDLLHATGRRDLLRLGVLLHDAGKVGGAVGHVERGVALVSAVAWRLGLDAAEARHVRFLVAEHLTLSRMAEKRDVDAPATIEELLRLVERDRERLDHLYLLTAADVRGVSPHALTRWKDYLLTRLYGHARDALDGVLAPTRPSTVEGWLAALAPRLDPAEAAGARAHLELCDRDYLTEVEPDEVLLHAELARELERHGGPCAVRCSLDEGCERVWVAARDRDGLLADLCGALTGSGHEILAVTTFARGDAVVFDRFAVAPGPSARGEVDPQPRWAALVATIADVVGGRADARDLIARRARREPGARRGPTPPPVRVRAASDVAPGLTLVDVSAPDRVGLLWSLTRAITGAGCGIRLAKIATKGDRAVDVFHVTGPDGGALDEPTRAALVARVEQACVEPPP